jgi:death-on-curing protein
LASLLRRVCRWSGSQSPVVDGNKRTALVAAFTFSELNGWAVQGEETAAVLVFADLAAGQIKEKELVLWLENNSKAQ